jgi:hypothetical protein
MQTLIPSLFAPSHIQEKIQEGRGAQAPRRRLGRTRGGGYARTQLQRAMHPHLWWVALVLRQLQGRACTRGIGVTPVPCGVRIVGAGRSAAGGFLPMSCEADGQPGHTGARWRQAELAALGPHSDHDGTRRAHQS